MLAGSLESARMRKSQQTPTTGPTVVIGAGLAGLAVALRLAQDQPVIVLAKRNLDEAATAWAQGGIVGVLGSDDSIESHVRDTQDAGAGLVDEHTARFIAERSARAVEWLVGEGVHRSKAALPALAYASANDPHPVVRKIAGWYLPDGPRYKALLPKQPRKR